MIDRYACRIIADSANPDGHRLTSFLVTYPLIVHAEVLRHRVLSHSVASARAIPTTRFVGLADFVPEAFGSARPGMVSGPALTGWRAMLAGFVWRAHGVASRLTARALAALGVSKEIANRPLAAHVWVTELVSGTDWGNFFALRCAPDAQPQVRRIAEMMRDAMAASTPRRVSWGGRHVPFACDGEPGAQYLTPHERQMVAAARIARLSYLRHDGAQDVAKDVHRAQALVEAAHWSPFEHVARARQGRCRNFRGWWQMRADLDGGGAEGIESREEGAA